MTSSTNRLRAIVDYEDDCPMPLENLPWTVFTTAADDAQPRAGVGLGAYVVDVAALSRETSLFDAKQGRPASPLTAAEACALFSRPTLNAYLAQPRSVHRAFRIFLQALFSADSAELLASPSSSPEKGSIREAVLIPLADARLLLPVEVGDYTDFCASEDHSLNMGRIMFNKPDYTLEGQWYDLPIAYHGRSSSVIPSGAPFHRPCGLFKQRGVPNAVVEFGPTRLLDYELELAFVVGGGPGNALGQRIKVEEAAEHVFGVMLMNDWSARDIQGYEMTPLGPFQGKNFATSVSPWIVETDALKPFSVPAPDQDPKPLPHLDERGAGQQFDIQLRAEVQAQDEEYWTATTETNYRYMYYTASQLVAHHTASGCPMRPGDLLGSGTISGPDSLENPAACLMEKTLGGKKPFELNSSKGAPLSRTFLQDGDTVRITGRCVDSTTGVVIGFGECSATILPALARD